MNYLIIGAGGTGGSVGAHLSRSGKDVTLIARGEHLAAIRREGLTVLHPDGPFTVSGIKACTMEEYQDRPDVVFVCVKGYSVPDTIPFLKRISDEHTVVIPILNIYGTGGRMQKELPGPLVTDGCIYVAAQIDKPGVIRMNGAILRVVFGVRTKEEYRPVLETIAQDLNESGILGILSDNIQRDALVKYSYVSAHGACGLYYGVSAEGIQKDGAPRETFIRLIREVTAVSNAMGITFEEDLAERNLKILQDLAPEATTSMQRDIAAGKCSEIDGLIYEMVRLGETYGVPVPEYAKIAGEMRRRGLS